MGELRQPACKPSINKSKSSTVVVTQVKVYYNYATR